MIKTLYLVRHAESSLAAAKQGDMQRNLTAVGMEEAKALGVWCKQQQILPEVVLFSPADRTRQTMEAICDVLAVPEQNRHPEVDIYNANTIFLLTVIQNQSDEYQSMMLVGHNPGLTSLVHLLAENECHDMLGTATICGFDFEIDSWKFICKHIGKLLFFEKPQI